MGTTTGIEWTDHTFNPWWGCTKVSAGCDRCYAETLSNRYGNDVWGAGKARRLFGEKHWNEPLRWNRAAEAVGVPARVFCGSMCDVMDAEAPDSERQKLWALIEATPWLHWQLLTKRPNLILRYMPEHWKENPPANVWWGTSVEDERVLWRVEKLLEVPAEVRFLSIEPLIGPLDLSYFVPPAVQRRPTVMCAESAHNCCKGRAFKGSASPVVVCTCECHGRAQADRVDWVIVGGESGPGARPMNPAWVRTIRDQCTTAGVPFFFKQWGEWRPAGRGYGEYVTPRGPAHIWPENDSAEVSFWVGKQAAGHLLDGREWHEFPEVRK